MAGGRDHVGGGSALHELQARLVRVRDRPTSDSYGGIPDPEIPPAADYLDGGLAELVGYMMADGHIARSNYNGKPAKLILAFGWDEDDLVGHFADSIRKSVRQGADLPGHSNLSGARVSGVDICGLLRSAGAGGPSGVIQVPRSLFFRGSRAGGGRISCADTSKETARHGERYRCVRCRETCWRAYFHLFEPIRHPVLDRGRRPGSTWICSSSHALRAGRSIEAHFP